MPGSRPPEQLVGKQALELEFERGHCPKRTLAESGNTSVIVGPRVLASQKIAG
jgi:hypothetical protein